MKWSHIDPKIDHGRNFLIRNLCNHHEQICPYSLEMGGDVFFAIRGKRFDGNAFVEEVIRRGARAIVSEEPSKKFFPNELIWHQVSDVAAAWTEAQRRFNGNPDKNLKIYAVTGTAGKTTVAYAIQQILGNSCGRLTTIDSQWKDRTFPSPMTTADARQSFANFREMLSDGCDTVAVELSSHGLCEKRLFAIPIEAAIFTNLSHEHLDYHSSMEEYFDAKIRLFDGRNGSVSNCIVTNGDDTFGRRLLKLLKEKNISAAAVGTSHRCQWRLLSCKNLREGSIIRFCHGSKCHEFFTKLIGDFQGMNLLQAIAATAHAVDLDLALSRLEQLHPVPGRMQRIVPDFGGEIFIDFAHKPAALECVLRSLRRRRKCVIHTLFGCGGERDREKRPMMAAIAERYSDFSIVCEDNSRNEPREKIFAEIIGGFRRNNFSCIPDRQRAIHWAVHALKKHRGMLLIAGKGHETIHETVQGKSFLSDCVAVEENLKNLRIHVPAQSKDTLSLPPKKKMPIHGFSKILILGRGITGQAVRKFCENQNYRWKICCDDDGSADISIGDIDLLVHSPGAINSPILQRAKNLGIPCIGDLDFAQKFYANPTVAITGTNGKTSTVHMLCHCLGKLSIPAIGTGNIGLPTIELVDTLAGNSRLWNVCEVSSFQAKNLKVFRPDYAIWTTFSPNHLDMHGDYFSYFLAKRNLLNLAKKKIFLSAGVAEQFKEFSIPLPSNCEVVSGITGAHSCEAESGGKLQFQHQINNFSLVERLLEEIAPWEVHPGRLLRDFAFPPHRLHLYRTIGNVSFWNDSKATNAAAVRAAVSSIRLKCDQLLWITGGRSKGEDVNDFASIVAGVAGTIAMGEMGWHIFSHFKGKKIHFFSKDDELRQRLRKEIESGDGTKKAVLFSPGFASFDRFKNYAERGNWFEREICDRL
ncbi:MAG: UDP-N-acetylmuramoyl-L-alanine--D-glutamate ligase [Puniceicoccales bacterium]|jgi:UDP-N-acetylmuramoyl-L-alanyl-D-glutamate--2,6-diaminopimelate ligase|nr:UDP-N-acetylmuramoyl-L-alanine--D-glutamate ligase [Puniceicoccales bacterium]